MKMNNTGFKIIMDVEPEAEISAQHDQIWVGSYGNRELMNDTKRKMMEDAGWFEDEDSWSHFT